MELSFKNHNLELPNFCVIKMITSLLLRNTEITRLDQT